MCTIKNASNSMQVGRLNAHKVLSCGNEERSGSSPFS
jgi:hypothetical protein